MEKRVSVEDLLADESLQRWVLGKATIEEKRYWEHWVQKDPERARAVEEAAEVIRSLRFKGSHEPTEEEIRVAWALLKTRLENGSLKENHRRVLRPVRQRLFLRMAAGFLLLVVAGAIAFGVNQGRWAFLSSKTYATDYGERASIQLPDGSSVVLNARSTLVAPRKYNRNRSFEIVLQGEAFFEVAQRSDVDASPFRVLTEHGEVSVLGTAFNLSCRDELTRVTLNEGRLQVTKSSLQGEVMMQTVLEAGQKAEFGHDTADILVNEVNPHIYSSWTTPLLWFEKTPFEEVVEMLEHTYGYEVRVEDQSVMDIAISGAIENDRAVLLDGLARMIDRSVIFNEGVIIIN